MSIDLKNYFCDLPFTYTEIHNDRQTMCCPYWNDTNLKKSPDYLKNWFSPEAEEVRESMLDGTFKNCSTEFCPHLNLLVNKGKATGPVRPISEFRKENYNKPKRIKLCFDETCNLKCPTCRTRLIANTEARSITTMNELRKLEESFSDELEEIFTSGTGDPFYSKPMREYLIDFPVEKYPKLKKIIIHTNGILFTPKIWSMLNKTHQYLTEVEISVDAATKDTYENKTRLGGKWDVLINNLKFISSIESIVKVTTSFVVQKENYTEMEDFVKLMKSIFDGHKDHTTYFYRVNNWGTFTNEQFAKINIFDNDHPDHINFVNEVKKLDKYNKIIANLYDEKHAI